MSTKSKIGKSLRMAAAIAHSAVLMVSTLGCLEEPDVEGTFDTLSCTVSEADYWTSIDSFVHTAAELDGFRSNSDPDALFCIQYREKHHLANDFCNINGGMLKKGPCKLTHAVAKCENNAFHRTYFIDSTNNLDAHKTECEENRLEWTAF